MPVAPSTGARPKVPQSFPAADMRPQYREVKGVKNRSPTLEEIEESWEKEPTPAEPNIPMLPPVLPPLPQRQSTHTQRKVEGQEGRVGVDTVMVVEEGEQVGVDTVMVVEE